MVVKNRRNNWVLRVFTKAPGENWFVACDQFYKTREEMRAGKKLWKLFLRSSTKAHKLKTYRIMLDSYSDVLNEENVWYKEIR